ncbi:MAG: hypothetical protein ACI865_002138 [Flavobacteriaceae bacterium]|jgi:hypothetical protein
MESPIDHVIDLGLVNYTKHPENPNYVVYRFADLERAGSFEAALKEQKIWYEKGSQERKKGEFTLFGIHKNDYKKTEQINYAVEAKHKKPFIPFKGFRYFLMTLSFGLLLLAILGYCNAQKKLRLHNESIVSVNQSK